MTSGRIQHLLVPPDVQLAQQKALLSVNSKYPSFETLHDLDSVVVQAQQRNDQLKSKLALSQSEIDTFIVDVRALAEEHLHAAQELSLSRHALADELSALSQDLVSSESGEEGRVTLLEHLETLHRNLNQLEGVKGYAQVIERALNLSESAVDQFRSSEPSTKISLSSLTHYKSLQGLVDDLSHACLIIEDDAEKHPLRLVQFLETIRDKTWADIKGFLSATLLSVSERLQWPMPVDYVNANAADRQEFENAFLNLLTLQTLGEKIRGHGHSEKDGLYPLQALVQPLSLRFKYHFDGTRQTNRLDKPEWYFTHVLNVVHEHRPFMESAIQTLISSSDYRGINAWAEFTHLLLPLLSRKIRHTIPALLPHPSLLAHTIYETLAFDAALVEEGFTISGTSASKNWRSSELKSDGEDQWLGISELILGKNEWFETWMDGEKKFAESQYDDIVSASGAWLIDDERGEEVSIELKTTNSARQIKALVEQVKDRYCTLPHFNYRMQFLVTIQLPLLQCYHERISSSLDAFESLSFAFTRAMPGALGVSLGGKDNGGVNLDASRLTSGVEGVQRLCKALVSAKFIAMAMSVWGEELFFLELWAEINRHASLRIIADASPLLPDTTSAAEVNPLEITLFDRLIKQYEKLVSRSEDMIVQQVCREIEAGLKLHFAVLTSPDSNVDQNDEIALSQTLLGPIAILSTHLTFLRSTLTQATMTAVYRRISSHLAEYILRREILYRGARQINLREGKAILAECELWIETCHAALNGVSRNRVERSWLNLYQAGKLIGADGDVWTRVVDLTFGVGSDEEWENGIAETIGICEMRREDAASVLRSREDCDR